MALRPGRHCWVNGGLIREQSHCGALGGAAVTAHVNSNGITNCRAGSDLGLAWKARTNWGPLQLPE